MQTCWCLRIKPWKRLFMIVAVTGLAAFWWLSRSRRPDVFMNYVGHVSVQVVGQAESVTLHINSNSEIELKMRSPDGRTRLRGTLVTGGGGGLLDGSLKSCKVPGSRWGHKSGCAAVRTSAGLLRLQVAYTGQANCYTVKWQTSSSNISVIDCFALDDALWYGGPPMFTQRWPINSQSAVMQPLVSGDYLLPEWRDDPSYGKYGSLAMPYWVSSAGVGIYVVDDHVALSSSFNAEGDGRLCLKGDRWTTVDPDEVPELLSYMICRGANVADVHKTMSNMLFPRMTGHPAVRTMRKPIWSTWAQYKTNVSQTSVEDMAKQIQYYKFPYSQLEIDDGYSPTYGQFDFDTKKFPNASQMVQSLHEQGFRVSTWITPFCNDDCPAAAEGAAEMYWVRTADPDSLHGSVTVPARINWWRGVGSALDVTNPAAVHWFTERLRQFSAKFGVDSFKFDAGEVSYLPARFHTAAQMDNVNQYTTLYAQMAAGFGGMTEVRCGYRSQQLPVFVRMLDKDSDWGYNNGLRSLIPTALLTGILGYVFVLPDMIGGNGYDSSGRWILPDRELFVRWVEVTAFLPAMQFSIVPWRYDDETIAIARKFAYLHETVIGDVIEAAAKDAVQHGWPIVRPLWWLSPTDPDSLTCDSEFLLGDRLLVAPVLHPGVRSRDVYLPGGPDVRWKDYFASNSSFVEEILPGGTWIRNKTVALDEIAVFLRVHR